jgi:hypothetical protein
MIKKIGATDIHRLTQRKGLGGPKDPELFGDIIKNINNRKVEPTKAREVLKTIEPLDLTVLKENGYKSLPKYEPHLDFTKRKDEDSDKGIRSLNVRIPSGIFFKR